MRIVFSRLIVLAALLGLAFSVACGGTASPATSGTTSSTSTSTTSTSASTATSSTPMTTSASSPTSSAASPVTASPAASPTAATTTLAQAFTALAQQPSLVMKTTLTGMTGIAAALPNAGPSVVVTTERNGNNAHITVANPDGTKLAQVWRIGNQQWLDMGNGPQPVSGDASQLAALTPIISAPDLLLPTFSGNAGQYTVSGQETVNGVPTTVEKGSFQVSNAAAAAALFPAASANVSSTIWVARQGGYLVRAQVQLGGATASTPGTGTPGTTSGTATITVDVTNVGSAPQISTPTP